MSYITRCSDDELETWLNHPHRRPLILRGARQVGKSTLVRAVAHRTKRRLVEINLETAPDLEKVFATLDLEKIVDELSFRSKTKLNEDALLFLDEAQACPSSLNALRYFWEKMPHLPVISAGSLLEFTLQNEKFSMPVGRVEYQFVQPFCFRDFLLARGLDDCVMAISDFVNGRSKTIPLSAHQRLLSELAHYAFIGGMPEALSRFLDEKSPIRGIDAARNIQNRIMLAYRDDFGKYGKRVSLEAIRASVEALPAVVGSTKVKYSSISRTIKAEQVRAAITALENAGLLRRVFHSSASGIPLGAGEDSSTFKILPLDVGLWVSQTFGNSATVGLPDHLFEKWLSDNEFERGWVGQIAEVIVGNSIIGQQKTPNRTHYWVREAKSSNAEVDFLVQHALTVVPIEVKAGSSGALKSLHLFMEEKGLQQAVRFDINPPSEQRVECRASASGGNIAKVSYTLHNLPIYAADWLSEYLAARL